MNQLSSSRSAEKKIRDDSFRLRFIKALASTDNSSISDVETSQATLLQSLSKGEDIGIRGLTSSCVMALVDVLLENLVQNKPSIICLSDPEQKYLLQKNLAALGLEELVLKLDKNTSLQDMIVNLQHARLQTLDLHTEVLVVDKTLAHNAQQALDSYAKRLAQKAQNTNISVYEFIAKALTESDLGNSASTSLLHIPFDWSPSQVGLAVSFAERVESVVSKGALLQDFSGLQQKDTISLSQALANLKTAAKECSKSLIELEQKNLDLNKRLGICLDETEAEIESKLNALTVINELFSDEGEYIKKLNLESKVWTEKADLIAEALRKSVDLADLISKSDQPIDLRVFRKVNLDDLAANIDSYNSKNLIEKFFSGSQANSIQSSLRYISSGSIIEPEEFIKNLAILKRIQILSSEVAKNSELLSKLFEPLISEWKASESNLRAWRKIQAIAEAVIEVKLFADQTANSTAVVEQMINPGNLYENEEVFKSCKEALLKTRQLRSSCLTLLCTDNDANPSTQFQMKLRQQIQHFYRLSELKIEQIQDSADLLELEKEANIKGYDFIFKAIVENLNAASRISVAIKDSWFQEQLNNILDHRDSGAILNQGVESVRQVLEKLLETSREQKAYEVKQKYIKGLPNIECGGRAALLSRLYEGSSELEPNINFLSLMARVMTRVKPILLIEPERLAELEPQLLSLYPAVVVSGSFHKLAADSLVKLDRDIKQLIAVADSERGAQRSYVEKDLFADYIKSELESQGLSVSRNVRLSEHVAELVVWTSGDKKIPQAIIVTDGPNYQQQRDFYQREFGVNHKFNKLGIPVFRAWISEWAEDKSDSLDRLLSDLDAVNELTGLDAAKVELNTRIKQASDYRSSLSMISTPYITAKLDKKTTSKLYRTGSFPSNLNQWVSMVVELVKAEGPIHKDLLKLRLREACDLSRNTDYFDSIYRGATSEALLNRRIVSDGDFFRTRKTDVDLVRDRSRLDWKYSLAAIPREEIELAILTIIDKSCGISHEDLTSEVGRALGVKLSEQNGLDHCIDETVKVLLKQQIVSQDTSGNLLIEKKSRLN